MLLLFIDAFIFCSVLIATFMVIRNAFRKQNEHKLEMSLVRQKEAEELAKKVDQLNTDQIKENEKKILDKLNGLQ